MKILIHLNRPDFEYDVFALVRSFYPGQDVFVCHDEAVPGQDAGTEDLTMWVRVAPDSLLACMRASGEEEDARGESVPLGGGEDRKEVKTLLKQLVYRVLSKRTGEELPWGNLTGIRPVKIARGLMDAGMTEEEIEERFRERYYVSPGKTALALSVAKTERALLTDVPYQQGYSLYVGIPFCPSICLYCTFGASPLKVWKGKTDEYLEALFKEMEAAAAMMPSLTPTTVYIGGGTPTTLEAEQLGRLLSKIEETFDLAGTLEFTVEAGRPDSITKEKLAVMRAHPVTRISINPQTMNQETLDLIGRLHTVDQIRDTFRLARGEGFDNINMDLIVGLPGEGEEEVARTMEEIRKLDPDSVTVHSLALKRAARLNLFRDQWKDISFTNSSRIMDMTAKSCISSGLAPYYLYRQKDMAGNFENVGYAREGKACLYNVLIMEEVQSILALGAAGSTKMVYDSEHIERIENVKDVRSYLDRIDEMIERKRTGIGKWRANGEF